MKKELLVFIGIFLFLAIGMHFKEWMSHPIDHIIGLPNSAVYGIGMIHPLVFTFVGYILFVFVRFIVRVFGKIGKKA